MTITPAGPRLAVVDPPVEEGTGLILPPGVGRDVDVGIVQDVGADVPAWGLSPGDKVYYHVGHGMNIGDVKVIGTDCVVAYEKHR